MGRNKDEWIEKTGSFFASPLERQARLQISALNEKAQRGQLSETERTELLRLLNSLPDDGAGDDL